MRVIAGSARGRPLLAPAGQDVRPTSDRVREALFSSLGSRVAGAVVCDLFAGSGALGIEALSRGAAHATFVESDARAAAVVAANLQRTGLAAAARVLRRDAARFVRQPTDGPYDLVFCDPPYAEPLETVGELLARLAAARGLAAGGVVVIERDRRRMAVAADLPPVLRAALPAALAPWKQRSYGDTVLLYLRVEETNS